MATINAEVLAKAGLIRGDAKPLKVLGQGAVGQKLFVAADAFSASARQKIEAAGGFVQLLAEPKAHRQSRDDGRSKPEATAESKPTKAKSKARIADAAKADAADQAEEPEQASQAETTPATAESPEVATAEAAPTDEPEAAEPPKPKRRAKSDESS